LSILAECDNQTKSTFAELVWSELRGEPDSEQARTVAMMEALNAARREFIAHTLATKRCTDFIALIPRLNNASSRSAL